MGGLLDWSTESDGAVAEERSLEASVSSSPSSSSCPGRGVIRSECLEKAEEVMRGLIDRIQPNSASEERRAAVIDYIQRLIRRCLGCEVFPFGSVPLKTYLPDGDIDLTAFGGMNAEETLAHNVFAVLEREDQNEDAEFLVKDVQLIWAEVKLVKCIIQNIVVDISFNQIGGLCTLCFLEQIDRVIGKDHLFKRSIILIKAWCYYESRILGAHHGLISTYALETLVLYVFHLFHASLDAPLAVLHKFLDYYSKFDWDKYCVSLSGPVLIASLPEFVVETPENDGRELLLGKDFLKECVEKFSVPSNGYGPHGRIFAPKHLNIVDPLKENNNLGRSVSKGSFFRIRSAFSFGVRKLEKVLCDPDMDIANELGEIFSNTLDRHGSGRRPDVQDIISEYDNLKLSDEDIAASTSLKEEPQNHEQVVLSVTLSEPDTLGSGVSLSDHIPGEEAYDVAESQSSAASNSSQPSKVMESSSQMSKMHHISPPFSSHLSAETRVHCNGFVDMEHAEYCVPEITVSGAVPFSTDGCSRENSVGGGREVLHTTITRNCNSISSPRSCSSEDNYLGYPGAWALQGTGVSNSLADLTGDFDSHLRSLCYGRWCHEYAWGVQMSHTAPPFIPQYQVDKSWDVVRRSLQHKREVFSKVNRNGVPTRPTYYPVNAPPPMSSSPFGVEEMSKSRGTGTYFPNTNHYYRDRNSLGRGRNQAATRSPRGNGRLKAERDFVERSTELTQPQFKSITLDPLSSSSPGSISSDANDSPQLSENAAEFCPSGQNTSITPDNVTSDWGSGNGIDWPQPVKDVNQERIPIRSYRLKDEGDFPPLS
ncbi:hypothetical protein MLD38_038366 [Melastoma candidum]|uniref:Uncharacterized protein n=1 Tax=Melastoma candidum TaxID=119954 RepID=A0ACB9L064_9MYRT|nr:hypothetical protein MLD38_038366 [Melastoma candidum]